MKHFINNRFKAFGFAFQGLYAGFKNETHLKIHLIACILVTISGFYLQLKPFEWIAVLTCCALVITAELFNSAIEALCNHVEPNINPKIKYIKDVCAAAVLVLTILSLIVAGIVFIPYLIK